MNRISKILTHHKYIDYIKRNEQAETNRIFCHHDLTHGIDVARVAYILALEENLEIKKSIIYTASLLHDIGRWKEYEDGIDHALIGAELAVEILVDAGFDSEEILLICNAIKNHRNSAPSNSILGAILYKSDKISRPCHTCNARNKCKRFKDDEQPILYY